MNIALHPTISRLSLREIVAQVNPNNKPGIRIAVIGRSGARPVPTPHKPNGPSAA